jgi:hypothetical protein
MIPFHRARLEDKAAYESILMNCPERGCEYSFANLYLWGRQEIAFIEGCVAFFSHFFGRTVYPYPIGTGDKRAVLEAIIADARERGIPCRISGMTEADLAELEAWFPGRFSARADRDFFDYVYTIDALADLKGKKLQKKRNHFNRFRAEHPDYQVLPINVCNLAMAQQMVNEWYRIRIKEDPDGDYLLENIAMARAFQNFGWLEMEGIMLLDGREVLAITMGSRLNENTFDIHFEKAREDVEGAYNAVNCEFARYLRLKYPEVEFLNREDDLGLEGLRKAKLSYYPHHLVEKCWACLLEDGYDY